MRYYTFNTYPNEQAKYATHLKAKRRLELKREKRERGASKW
jgi:hypothetical protein